MLNSIKYSWLIWVAGIALFAVVAGYAMFCWYAVQTTRAQGQQLANIRLVPVGKVMERVITQSLDEDGAVIGQSVKRVFRERYYFRMLDRS